MQQVITLKAMRFCEQFQGKKTGDKKWISDFCGNQVTEMNTFSKKI